MQPIIINNTLLNRMTSHFLDLRFSALRTVAVYMIISFSLVCCGLEWLVLLCVKKVRSVF